MYFDSTLLATTEFLKKEVAFDASQKHGATMKCAMHSWCNLVCIDSATQLILTATLVSPFYQNQTSDAKLCFTNKKKDKAYGSTIIGTHLVSGARLASHLSKGFLNTYQLGCFDVRHPTLWMVVDFGKTIQIQTVVFTSSPWFPNSLTPGKHNH